MSKKAERTRLLEQIFADRLPQLDAATNAAVALADAGRAVELAEARRQEAAEELRTAYDGAVAAGWSEVDLRLVGVARPRRPSPRRPRSASTTRRSDAATA